MTSSRLPLKLPTNLSIPTLPSIVHEIGAAIDDPDAGLGNIGARIAKDAPLSGKVLRIVNSSFYGLQERCHSVERASAILGLKLLRNVVTQAAVIQTFEHLKATGFDLDRLWQHAALVAQVSATIARRSRSLALQRPDEVYLAGLMHDIGQIVLFDNLKQEYVLLVQRAAAEALPLDAIERRDLGVSHAEVGATVMTNWGFPANLVAAVQHHHRRDQASQSPLTALIASTNMLVERASAGHFAAAEEAFDPAVMKLLGVSGEAIRLAIQSVKQAEGEALAPGAI